MNRFGLPRFLACLATAALLASPPLAAQENAAPKTGTAELPPLPPPTEAQLQRGRELLDKLAHVVENVSLQDAGAVLAAFGFTEYTTTILPTYTRVYPKGAKSERAGPAEYAGTGLTSLTVDPLVRQKGVQFFANMQAEFDLEYVCITPEEVHARYGKAAHVRVMPKWSPHSIRVRKKTNKIGYVVFEPIAVPINAEAQIGFTFDYQKCANSVGVNYLELLETKQ